MEIAVLGGGHGCYAAAAELSEKGHRVRFWRRDAVAFAPVLEKGSVTLSDYRGRRSVPIHKPTADLAEAVAGAELIVIPLPATAQAGLAPALAPHLEDGQVVFLPPGSFGTILFARALNEAGNRAEVAFGETGTLPYLVRKHGPAEVAISAYATRLPTGVTPARFAAHAFSPITAAYPAVEPILQDALDGALMNAGPIIHPPLILMNAGPLEHFETWDIHNEGTQPSIRRVTDALDGERVRLREASGYGAPHFPLSDHYSQDGDEWMYGRKSHERLHESGDWREDIDLTSHRYMLEDVELGLALLVSLGRWAGVEMPVAAGLLALGSAVAGRDFLETGRTWENLGLAELSRDALRQLLHEGLAP